MSYFKEDWIPTCSYCKHACYYPISFLNFRYTNPKCEISKLDVKPDDVACEYFYGNGMRIMKLVVKFKQKYYRQIVRGVKTQTEFDDDFVDYREDAKKRWKK